jgi:outer membrane protein assembly factor BamB
MRNRIASRSAFALALLLTGLLTGGADWPRWRGPSGDGTSAEKEWSPQGPTVKWKAKIGVGFAGVSVAEGRVFAMGSAEVGGGDVDTDTVFCFDAETGAKVWSYSYPAKLVNAMHEGGPSSTPLAHDGKVYTLSKVGDVHCFTADKGEVVWKADLKADAGVDVPMWGFTGSPVVMGGNVVFQAGPTVALDLKSGKVAWKSKAYKPAYTTPALFEMGGKPALATLNQWGLVILDGAGNETGQYPWATQFDTNATTPLVNGDRVFLSTGYEKGCAMLKLQPGELGVVFRNKHLSNHMNDSVWIGDHLYGFDGNAHRASNNDLVCLDARTGRDVWRQKGMGCGSLIAADGKLIVLSDRGDLVIAEASPAKFTAISRTPVLGGKCWTAPSLARGLVYCRNNDRGDLVCVSLRK